MYKKIEPHWNKNKDGMPIQLEKELKMHNELDDDDHSFDVYLENIRKVLVVGDFNARVGTYQHFKDDDDVVVRDQTLHDLRIRILSCDIMLGFSYTCLNAQT